MMLANVCSYHDIKLQDESGGGREVGLHIQIIKILCQSSIVENQVHVYDEPKQLSLIPV